MTSRLEDLIGKTLIVVIFLYLASNQLSSIAATIRSSDQGANGRPNTTDAAKRIWANAVSSKVALLTVSC